MRIRTLRVKDFHIGFEYEELEPDKARYINKGLIWVRKVYGFDSPKLTKIKKKIDDGVLRHVELSNNE